MAHLRCSGLPSVEKSEAFGLVQLEAMAFGKPVVNTELPTGVPFVSVDNQTGFTVPPRDSSAMAEAIERLMAAPEAYSRFSRNALRRVEEVFSKEKVLEELYGVYIELMEKRV